MRSANLISNWVALTVAVIVVATTRNALAANPTSAELLQEASAAAATIDDADERADMLNYLVMTQARTGDIAGAKRTAETISVPLKKNFAYGHIATALAYAGDVDGAKALVDVVTDASAKSMIYEGIVEAVADRGDVAKAKAMAVRVTDPFYAAHAQEHIAMAQAEAADFAAAKATIGAISGPGDVIVEAYVRVAEICLQSGKEAEGKQMIDLATAAAKQVPEFLLPLALADIAEAQIRAGQLDSAMQIAARASAPGDKALILQHVAAAQIKMGDLDAAKNTAHAFTNAFDEVSFDTDLAAAQAAKGDKDGARRLLKDADALAATIIPAPIGAMACEAIGTTQVRVNDVVIAADWARSQKDPEVRVRALIGVVEGLPDYHHPELP